MASLKYLDDDIVRVYEVAPPGSRRKLLATLFWGDRLKVLRKHQGKYEVELPRREWDPVNKRYRTVVHTGNISGQARFREEPLLKVRFIDVGQGDGAIVESPKRKIILIDGGEEEHMRRYINVAFSHVLRWAPLNCEAIVVTHGDADHFSGLTTLLRSSRSATSPLITAGRVFHNGLVKRTAERDTEAFGRTVRQDGITYAVDLFDDLLDVPDTQMNRPFKAWKRALETLQAKAGTPEIRRLQYGDDEAFDFLQSEGIKVKVLGPIVDKVNQKPALRFLRHPGSQSLSASHTVNGHSVVLKLTYGNVRFLFGADLNEESEERLLSQALEDGFSLTAEILKVPHHGSADFSPRMLEAVRPVVSVVSSGDESEAKEYIHPRAGLMGALGKYSRGTVDKPLVYATEMVAFFRRLREADEADLPEGGASHPGPLHNLYQKAAFGIVHVRTDGARVLVATHSGRDDQKESYAFQVNERGDVTFEPETSIV